MSVKAEEAGDRLPGVRQTCSRAAGWTSLLLRRYREPLLAEAFETAATADQLIVLVAAGATRIESLRSGRWTAADYRAGDLGMTGPGEAARLRWSGPQAHITLQLHLPATILEAAAADLRDQGERSAVGTSVLSTQDQLVRATMMELDHAMSSGLPDLYAASAAHLLAVHLISRHPSRPARENRDALVLARVEEFMRVNLSGPIALVDLAGVAGCTTFQLIRLTKRGWGQTPFEFLTRLRMERARGLLAAGRLSTAAVALACGYANPSHFATAFRRMVGTTPTDYRSTIE